MTDVSLVIFRKFKNQSETTPARIAHDKNIFIPLFMVLYCQKTLFWTLVCVCLILSWLYIRVEFYTVFWTKNNETADAKSKEWILSAND